jgi:hypothetical protein
MPKMKNIYIILFFLALLSCNKQYVRLSQKQAPNSTMFEFQSYGFIIRCSKNDLLSELNKPPLSQYSSTVIPFLEQISTVSIVRFSDDQGWDKSDIELHTNKTFVQMAGFQALKNGNATVFNTETKRFEGRIKVIRHLKKNYYIYTQKGKLIAEIAYVLG